MYSFNRSPIEQVGRILVSRNKFVLEHDHIDRDVKSRGEGLHLNNCTIELLDPGLLEGEVVQG